MGRWRKLADFLTSPRAGRILPCCFLGLIVVAALILFAQSHLIDSGWQFSNYYFVGVSRVLEILLGLAWLVSIVLLFVRRKTNVAIFRLVATLAVLIASGILSIYLSLILYDTPSAKGWPCDSVYSPSRDKYYILAYESVPTDVCYAIYSAAGSRLNPIWKKEFAETMLDYSEDGSLTENPHLILSEDEKLLVVGRGGELTDAILIETGEPLATGVPWDEADRKTEWISRTERIRLLLAEHARPIAKKTGSP